MATLQVVTQADVKAKVWYVLYIILIQVNVGRPLTFDSQIYGVDEAHDKGKRCSHGQMLWDAEVVTNLMGEHPARAMRPRNSE